MSAEDGGARSGVFIHSLEVANGRGVFFFLLTVVCVPTMHGLQAFAIVCGFIKKLADFLEIRMGYLNVVAGILCPSSYLPVERQCDRVGERTFR